jgi:transcriptional regulator with XRE-family HTH domain
MSAASLIRSARTSAGLTQAQLAERMGVQQPVVARLERTGSDPRFSTVVRALQAVGQGVYVSPAGGAQVDEPQIAANLRLSPADRLTGFEHSYANVRELVARARRVEP